MKLTSADPDEQSWRWRPRGSHSLKSGLSGPRRINLPQHMPSQTNTACSRLPEAPNMTQQPEQLLGEFWRSVSLCPIRTAPQPPLRPIRPCWPGRRSPPRRSVHLHRLLPLRSSFRPPTRELTAEEQTYIYAEKAHLAGYKEENRLCRDRRERQSGDRRNGRSCPIRAVESRA